MGEGVFCDSPLTDTWCTAIGNITIVRDSIFDLSDPAENKALYSNNSDGHARFLNVEKPFYALDSTSAHGVSLLDDDRSDSFFNAGQVVGEYRHEAKRAENYRGFSKGW